MFGAQNSGTVVLVRKSPAEHDREGPDAPLFVP